MYMYISDERNIPVAAPKIVTSTTEVHCQSCTGVYLSWFTLFVSLYFMGRYPIPERFLISDTLNCCE